MNFQFGSGNDDNQPMPNDFGFLYKPSARAPDTTKLNWQYGTGTYTVTFTLTKNGDWTLKDESNGVDVRGNLNTITPNP
jgi:hypothetical protein